MGKPRMLSMATTQEAVAKADALAALTGLSRCKAVTAILENMDPRQAAREHFERRLAGEAS